MEEWSGLKYHQILYDSLNDGKSSKTFRNKIINHSQLYFNVIDSNNNVFGHYHHGIIDKTGSNYDNIYIFIFTLNSNERCGIKKFNNKSFDVCTWICNDNNFIFCDFSRNIHYSAYCVSEMHFYKSCCVFSNIEYFLMFMIQGYLLNHAFIVENIIMNIPFQQD